MPGGPSLAVLHDVRTLFDAGTATGLSDRQLLERFAGRRDASSDLAFEVLVVRHGPMVLRVCRNLLRNPDDALDAFQATFLVLVQQSGSIRQRESVGGWLYGVACRIAARARVETARRRKFEERRMLRVVEAVEPSSRDETDEAEFGPIVQDEVRRLPERYRTVVVLCYWQGLTQEQAAAQLGCPLGTVRSRLARARKLLHRRLTRRGSAPLAGVVAALIDGGAASAVPRLPPVAPELLHSTVQAMARVAAGSLTSQVATGLTAYLVQRTLWSITMLKISSVLAATAVVGIMGIGVAIAAQRAVKAPTVGTVGHVVGESTAKNKPHEPAEAGRADSSGVGGQTTRSDRTEKLYSNMEGYNRIIAIVPNGSWVKKGDVVCELDSAAIRDKLVDQDIATKTAAANSERAKLGREVAEIAVIEYVEGIYVCELQEIEMQIKTAQAELAVAEDDLEAAREAFKQHAVPGRKRAIAELTLQKARFALELAQSRRKLLVDYTRGKRIKELKAAVEVSRAEEIAKKAVWDLAVSKQTRLERQVVAAAIRAPIDGTLVYAKPDGSPGTGQAGTMMAMMGGAQHPIREGAAVHERQLLFEIIPGPEAKK
jgi:RNA polymerase sigma factor (sigma-70 family)